MRKFLYICLILVLAAACGPRKIPRDKMESIMADLYIQEQQIKQDRELKKQADTSLVYEGIFRSYGYNTDDFIYSLGYYLEDATRMEKIMGEVAEKLDQDAKDVDAQIKQEQWRSHLLALYNMRPDTTRRPQPRPGVMDTLRVRFQGDSVHLYYPPDTLKVPLR